MELLVATESSQVFRQRSMVDESARQLELIVFLRCVKDVELYDSVFEDSILI